MIEVFENTECHHLDEPENEETFLATCYGVKCDLCGTLHEHTDYGCDRMTDSSVHRGRTSGETQTGFCEIVRETQGTETSRGKQEKTSETLEGGWHERTEGSASLL